MLAVTVTASANLADIISRRNGCCWSDNLRWCAVALVALREPDDVRCGRELVVV